MKNLITSIVVCAILFATSINTFAGNTFNANASTSKVEWTAKKVLSGHNGIVNIKDGSITIDGDNLTAASFNVDMTSIKVLDLKSDNEGLGKLTGHLRSDDFFSVDKHNTASFKMKSAKLKSNKVENGTKVLRYTITGDLTIKGITKSITFDAQVKDLGDKAEAYAFLKVDRTNYDIKYGSKNFFEGLGDKAIDNEFTLNISLQLSK